MSKKKLSIDDAIRIEISENFFVKGKVTSFIYEFGTFYVKARIDKHHKTIRVPVDRISKQ